MRHASFATTLLGAVLLTGCAHSAQRPLVSNSGVRATPVAPALSQEASTIAQPYLASTTIDLAQPLSNAIATLVVVNVPDLKPQRTRTSVNVLKAFAARLLADPTLSFSASRVVTIRSVRRF